MMPGYNAVGNWSFLVTVIGGLLTRCFTSTTALTIEPNHDKPCVVGDAWAEECMSCICSEGSIATCKPSFCAMRLKRDLDDCKEGEITKVDCNTCRCKNNVKVCTKYDCDNPGPRRTRKFKKGKKKGRELYGKYKIRNPSLYF